MMWQLNDITFNFGVTFSHGNLDRNNYRIALVDCILRLGFSIGLLNPAKLEQEYLRG